MLAEIHPHTGAKDPFAPVAGLPLLAAEDRQGARRPRLQLPAGPAGGAAADAAADAAYEWLVGRGGRAGSCAGVAGCARVAPGASPARDGGAGATLEG